jgi:hypothetical protein
VRGSGMGLISYNLASDLLGYLAYCCGRCAFELPVGR